MINTNSVIAWALNNTQSSPGVTYHDKPGFKLTGYLVIEVVDVPLADQLRALQVVQRRTDGSAYSRADLKAAIEAVENQLAAER